MDDSLYRLVSEDRSLSAGGDPADDVFDGFKKLYFLLILMKKPRTQKTKGVASLPRSNDSSQAEGKTPSKPKANSDPWSDDENTEEDTKLPAVDDTDAPVNNNSNEAVESSNQGVESSNQVVESSNQAVESSNQAVARSNQAVARMPSHNVLRYEDVGETMASVPQMPELLQYLAQVPTPTGGPLRLAATYMPIDNRLGALFCFLNCMYYFFQHVPGMVAQVQELHGLILTRFRTYFGSESMNDLGAMIQEILFPYHLKRVMTNNDRPVDLLRSEHYYPQMHLCTIPHTQLQWNQHGNGFATYAQDAFFPGATSSVHKDSAEAQDHFNRINQFDNGSFRTYALLLNMHELKDMKKQRDESNQGYHNEGRSPRSGGWSGRQWTPRGGGGGGGGRFNFYHKKRNFKKYY